ncbi:MAG: HAD family hydrolase [Pseudonocardiaceae bacterium]
MTDASLNIVAHLPETLILWDIDHTLIENGGVSKETYALAFELLTGCVPSVRPTTDGRTDFQIMHKLLSANSIDTDKYFEIAQFEGVLIEAMERNASQLPRRGHILPGVIEALAFLSSIPAVIQSVLTGNIASNARAKLSAFHLDAWLDLDVGGFGSDDKVRSNLVDTARQRVSTKYGKIFDRSSTILIGDTLFDVKAAHDGGAKILAVATGIYSALQLTEAGADLVLDNLGSTDQFIAALVRLRSGEPPPRS